MPKVILRNGKVESLIVHQYNGACFKGQATMYSYHPTTHATLWLKPVKVGEETFWLEDDDKVNMLLWEKFPEEMATKEDTETIVLRLLDRLYRWEN